MNKTKMRGDFAGFKFNEEICLKSKFTMYSSYESIGRVKKYLKKKLDFEEIPIEADREFVREQTAKTRRPGGG